MGIFIIVIACVKIIRTIVVLRKNHSKSKLFKLRLLLGSD